jgi:hypothetical protein
MPLFHHRVPLTNESCFIVVAWSPALSRMCDDMRKQVDHLNKAFPFLLLLAYALNDSWPRSTNSQQQLYNYKKLLLFLPLSNSPPPSYPCVYVVEEKYLKELL